MNLEFLFNIYLCFMFSAAFKLCPLFSFVASRTTKESGCESNEEEESDKGAASSSSSQNLQNGDSRSKKQKEESRQAAEKRKGVNYYYYFFFSRPLLVIVINSDTCFIFPFCRSGVPGEWIQQKTSRV